jgi:hypothetical protein
MAASRRTQSFGQRGRLPSPKAGGGFKTAPFVKAIKARHAIRGGAKKKRGEEKRKEKKRKEKRKKKNIRQKGSSQN